ncbi:Cell wall assembly regulator [Serendipita sp. 405]|nr:Cell wall assembly regulator [Serendipita sp. 405]
MAGFLRMLTNLINGDSTSSNSRRGDAMSSTHDAFSIPTHSPTFINRSPSPDYRSGNNADSRYSYPPPQSPGPYSAPSYSQPGRDGDLEANGNERQQGGSILPVHSSSRGAYPPLYQSWSRIQAWLARHYPELGDTLNYGALPADLQEIQQLFGFALPPTVRESYLRIDGQEAESSAGCTEGLFFGLQLLSLEEMLEEWKFWREVDDDPTTGANPKLQSKMRSIPSGWIRCDYSNRGWLPLATDRVGNYLGVDMSPGEKGAPGQVIVFGRDFDTKVVLWRGDGEAGWAKWLASFAEELETGDTFEVGNQDTNSEGSEDSIGHEPYFFDGSANGNRGEGGGDGGAVGLRLNGEYRGWNVLEALADRSVKKWKDAGVVTDDEYPYVDPRRLSSIAGMKPIQTDTGVEVPIPIIGDEPTSGLAPEDVNKPLPTEPETPRARTHRPAKSSVSANRPAPRPIGLPTVSDIAIDVEDSAFADNDTIRRGNDVDLERGNRLPLEARLQGAVQDGPMFSPRISGEDTELLKRISVEPPTPVTTDSTKELISLPHKRQSPDPDDDLLIDDPPSAVPLVPVSPKSSGSQANGQVASPSTPTQSEIAPSGSVVVPKGEKA